MQDAANVLALKLSKPNEKMCFMLLFMGAQYLHAMMNSSENFFNV